MTLTKWTYPGLLSMVKSFVNGIALKWRSISTLLTPTPEDESKTYTALRSMMESLEVSLALLALVLVLGLTVTIVTMLLLLGSFIFGVAEIISRLRQYMMHF